MLRKMLVYLVTYGVLLGCSDTASNSPQPAPSPSGSLEFQEMTWGRNNQSLTFDDDAATIAITLPNHVEAQGNLGIGRAFRFATDSAKVLQVSAYSKSLLGCNGDPALSVQVLRLNEDDTLGEDLGRLEANLSLALAPGRYAVVIRMAAMVQCDSIRVGFAAELSSASPVDESDPEATVEDNRSTNRGTTAPVATAPVTSSPEDNRVLQKLVRDDLLLRFYAFVSPTDKCQVVYERTAAEIKVEAQAIYPVLAAPLKLASVSHSGLDFEVSLRQFDAQMPLDLLELNFWQQPDYPDAWQESIRSALLGSEPIAFSLDSTCQTADRFWVQSLYSIGSLPISYNTTSHEEALPLRNRVVEGAGITVPDARMTYAYPGFRWRADLSIDHPKLLKKVGDPMRVKEVKWMLANRSHGFPLSDWFDIPADQFLGGGSFSLVIDDESLAQKILFRQFDHSIVFRVRFQNDRDGTSNEFFVFDYGRMCSAAYNRADGAAFHQALFADLSNPSWLPNRELQQGCAYAGDRWW